MHALRLIHRWIGIVLAVPVVLVAVSGSLLLARDPYYRARFPAVADGTPADLATQSPASA